MTKMTPKELEYRWRQVMKGIAQVHHHYANPEHLQRRSYYKGDMRCTHCKKWLNPLNPQDAKEITNAKRGKMHSRKYCKVYSPYTATLIMFAKFRPTRSRRVAQAKRY